MKKKSPLGMCSIHKGKQYEKIDEVPPIEASIKRSTHRIHGHDAACIHKF